MGPLALASCFATASPLRTIEVLAAPTEPAGPTPRADTLVVMLPGIGDEPEAYEEHGLLAELKRRALPVDVVAVDAHFGYYKKRELLPRLREDVFDVARSRGYRSIWIVGLSMGGLGALLAAREFGDQVDGLVLISPFLGKRSTVRRIEAAGGPQAWAPPAETSSDYTVELWRWLDAYATDPASRPPLYLAYGTDERNRGHAMLAEQLPAERVVVEPGGHDWDTWMPAWSRLLELGPFGHEPVDSPRAPPPRPAAARAHPELVRSRSSWPGLSSSGRRPRWRL